MEEDTSIHSETPKPETHAVKTNDTTGRFAKNKLNVPGVPDDQIVPATLFEKFAMDYQPMTNRSFFGVIDTTLKRPARVAHTLLHGPEPGIIFYLVIILLICLTGIGFMMGSFSGGPQLLMVPLKVVIGTVISGLICMPSLYILTCLAGGNQTFGQVGSLLLLSLVLAGILFLGFMPVAWIFSEATNEPAFMGMLYAIIWGTGLFFGMRLLKTTLRFVNRKSMGPIGLWVIVFILVLLQMSTTVRPLIGEYEPLQFAEKTFFLTHWFNQ